MYPCPACGCEFADINQFLEHRAAAIKRMHDRERQERLRDIEAQMLRQWGGSSWESGTAGADPHNVPAPPSSDPGQTFLNRFTRRG